MAETHTYHPPPDSNQPYQPMTCQEKVLELRQRIHTTLPQLIGPKCAFLDLPYYQNIGDVLIWEGTEQFLEDCGIRCIYKASKETFDWRDISADTTIILQGGGNFGDVWLPHQQFRMQVIERYKANKIIVLPQTVYYEDLQVLKQQAALFASHPDLTLCARDKATEALLREHFRNETVLLPDMAFCISTEHLARQASPAVSGSTLFVRRRDKEFTAYDFDGIIPPEADVRDWPSFERKSRTVKNYYHLLARKQQLGRMHLAWLIDSYADHLLRPHYVRTGVRFVSAYQHIYTTRLHVAILSTLLGKEFTFFDNSYGKNSSFFETWLSDTDRIHFIYNKHN